MSSPKYQPINAELEKGEIAYFPANERDNFASSLNIHISRPGAILLGIGLFISGMLTTWLISVIAFRIDAEDTYEAGFQEEILLPQKAIQLEQLRFQTPVDFEPNGHEILVTTSGEKAFAGEPSAEIDHNWMDLLWGRYFSISEHEAKRLWGDEYEAYWDHVRTGYTAGFDLFHQLHCLNQIRQALHRDVYPEIPVHGAVHTAHCINHLRQAIMCWGSTAIVPLKYFEGYNASYVKSDAVHTCRKFQPIREFVAERFNGSLFVERPSGWVDNEQNAF